jgi:hypothetical protein
MRPMRICPAVISNILIPEKRYILPANTMTEVDPLGIQWASVSIQVLEIVDPPHCHIPLIMRGTAHLHVLLLAASPPTILLNVAESIEQPHEALALQE